MFASMIALFVVIVLLWDRQDTRLSELYDIPTNKNVLIDATLSELFLLSHPAKLVQALSFLLLPRCHWSWLGCSRRRLPARLSRPRHRHPRWLSGSLQPRDGGVPLLSRRTVLVIAVAPARNDKTQFLFELRGCWVLPQALAATPGDGVGLVLFGHHGAGGGEVAGYPAILSCRA